MNRLISWQRPSLPQLLQYLLFLALCSSAAYWSAEWIRPAERRLPPARVTPATGPQAEGARLLSFGQPEAETAPGMSLRGVLYEAGTGRGIALLAVGDTPAKAFRIGDAVAEGLVLTGVSADQVTLGGAARQLTVPLASRTEPASAQATAPAVEMPATPTVATAATVPRVPVVPAPSAEPDRPTPHVFPPKPTYELRYD